MKYLSPIRFIVNPFLAFILVFLPAHANVATSSPSQEELKQIDEILDNIKPIYSSFGITISEPKGPWAMQINSDVYYDAKTHYISDANQHYNFTFLEADNQIISFCNGLLLNALFSSSAKLYSKPPPPTWTSKKAIEIAQRIFPIFNKRPEVIFDKPRTRFDYPFEQLPKYYSGVWDVYWDRIDGKGHPFASSEYIRVQLAESAGLIGVDIRLPSRYSEIAGKELTEAEALKEAQKYAADTASWPGIGFTQGTLESNPRGAEMIVWPNHLLQGKGFPLKHDLNARLAWVFWFPWHGVNNLGGSQAVCVWIDAHTGEYLGGDAAL